MKISFALAIVIAFLTFASASGQEKKPTKGDKIKKQFDEVEGFKTGNPDFNPSAKIQDDGSIVLKNRGAVFSKALYEKGCVVRCKFQWTEGKEGYPDHFSVVVRSPGVMNKDRPFEVEEGLVIKCNPAGKGFIRLSEFKQGIPEQQLASAPNLEFKQNTVYAIEVTDDGNEITVKINGRQVLKKAVEKSPGGKAGVYNREVVSDATQTAEVADLSVTELKKKK